MLGIEFGLRHTVAVQPGKHLHASGEGEFIVQRRQYIRRVSAITVFGLYWAIRAKHQLIWRRNLTIIATQWTLWWGIPTFLVVFLGRNPWTPLISRSLNAWPLNMSAFRLDPVVGPGDPTWWHTIAVVAARN